MKKAVVKKTKKPLKKVKKLVKKSKKILAQPKGYASVTPYLIVDNGKKAIEFYKKAFGAKEIFRMDAPDGKIGHAELKIGDSKIMLGDECSEKGSKSPKTIGGSPMSIYLYVKNVDATMKSAVAAGATVIREAQDMFYGDRSGGLQDPSGHLWYVATHIEDVTPAQCKKRMAELFSDKK
ncbi:MAG: PhnB [uncultured bacterium]|nr:MAG: PhnB [uncultured bacterium]